MNSSKSYDVNGDLDIDFPYINRNKKKKIICASDKFLSNFMWKLYTPTLRGDLFLLLVKLTRTASSKLNVFLFIAIRARAQSTYPLSYIVLCNQVLSHHKVENHVRITFRVLCEQVLSRLKVKNHEKISYIVLCDGIFRRLKMKNHVKIYFIVLRNQVLSRHKEENFVKICFIVLRNYDLSRHKVENHVKINLFYWSLKPSFVPS